jgi:hypothetical protein
MTGDVVRLHMWSGPRNLSTAMMRAFENRPDTAVVDEPFYAAYLARTGLDHPGRDQVLASQPTAEDDVRESLLAPLPDQVRLHYVKQMTHHLAPDSDLGWSLRFRNVLLIRDPAEVVASYVRSREACEPEDIGLLQQQRMVAFWDAHDATPPIIDAGDFLHDPEAHLRWLCGWLGLPFTDRMLSWPPGPRDTDGVWAPHWYAAVQASTGFEPRRPRDINLSEHDAAVAEACRPAYDALAARRLRLIADSS